MIIHFLCIVQVIRTARYFNNASQPNGQTLRIVSVNIPESSAFDTDSEVPVAFSACHIRVTVINEPDSPMVNLPER